MASGAEALEALTQGDRFKDVLGFDIVIMDLNMSPSDGFDTLHAIRGDERSVAIPIVIMSNSRDQRDVTRAYRCGANSYVIKPMTLEGAVEAAGTLARYWLEIVSLPRAE